MRSYNRLTWLRRSVDHFATSTRHAHAYCASPAACIKGQAVTSLACTCKLQTNFHPFKHLNLQAPTHLPSQDPPSPSPISNFQASEVTFHIISRLQGIGTPASNTQSSPTPGSQAKEKEPAPKPCLDTPARQKRRNQPSPTTPAACARAAQKHDPRLARPVRFNSRSVDPSPGGVVTRRHLGCVLTSRCCPCKLFWICL